MCESQHRIIPFKQQFSDLRTQKNLLEGLLTQIVSSILRVSHSVGLGWGPRICIPNKFPDDADFAGLGTTLWKPCTKRWEAGGRGRASSHWLVPYWWRCPIVWGWNYHTYISRLTYRGEANLSSTKASFQAQQKRNVLQVRSNCIPQQLMNPGKLRGRGRASILSAILLFIIIAAFMAIISL